MAGKLLRSMILNPINKDIKSRNRFCHFVTRNQLHTSGNEVPVKEVHIPVKWGHIAGKLWGKEQGRPILALHGWQDNAGTWDALAPILAKDRSILAIDFPGHGLSSWIPPGLHYYAWELPRLLLYLKNYFKWDKVSLLCHSMGSICGLRYASLFPDSVDFYVAIDNLVADDYDFDCVIEKYANIIEKLDKTQMRLNEEPPSYTLEEMAQIWHLGTRKSVSLESVHHLMKRGVMPSKKHTNKFYFSRDSRLKYTLFNPEDKIFVEAMAKRLQVPTLYIKAMDSPYAADGFSVEMRELIEKNNEKFESHYVPGTHHVHLNEPHKLVPLIQSFLKKYNV